MQIRRDQPGFNAGLTWLDFFSHELLRTEAIRSKLPGKRNTKCARSPTVLNLILAKSWDYCSYIWMLGGACVTAMSVRKRAEEPKMFESVL